MPPESVPFSSCTALKAALTGPPLAKSFLAPPSADVCKTWDTSCLADGKYELAVMATDKADNSCISEVVCVTVDNTPPTIPAITNPKGGEKWLNAETYDICWNTPSDTNFKCIIIDLLKQGWNCLQEYRFRPAGCWSLCLESE